MSVTHADALPTGFILDEFRIERMLGHGGFGLTYLARDTRLNSLYAIKEFLPQGVAKRVGASLTPTSPDQAETFGYGLQRFKEEARSLARFRHPHIARVTRLLEANGTAYMVMEYEPGLTLGELLIRDPTPVSAAEALAVALPILDGLAALHDAGLIHRDIKPSNVFLRAKGGPMLIDFGAARSSIGGQAPLTATFTPGFAPIEQYTPDATQGPPTDLYAYGATLYRMVTGRTPPDAVRRSAALGSGRPDPYAPATEYSSEALPEAFMECIDWALEYQYDDRPANALVLADRLRALDIEPQDIHPRLVATGAIDSETAVGVATPIASAGSGTEPRETSRAGRTPARLVSALKELRRRKVFKVGVTYLVAGAATTQLLSAVAGPFGISPTMQKYALLGLLAGFPVSLMLSWAFEWTPHGIRRTSERGRGSLRRFELAIIALMTMAVGALSLSIDVPSSRVTEYDRPTLFVALPEDLRPEPQRSDQFPQRIRHAVLEALSNDPTVAVVSPANDPRASGGSADVVPAPRVSGATHLIDLSLKTDQLNAQDDIVVSVRLVDAVTTRSLASYSLRFRQGIRVPAESTIASTIIGVARLVLGNDLWAAGGSIRSASEEAAHLLRLAQVSGRYELGDPPEALLKRALVLDPDFHQAHAMLLMHQALSKKPSEAPEFLAQVRESAKRGAQHGYHLALAWMLYITGSNDEALGLLDRAERYHSKDPWFYLLRAWVNRALGRFDAELRDYETSSSLDPYFAWPLTNVGVVGLAAHEYGKAMEALVYARSRWTSEMRWSYWIIHADLAATGSTLRARRQLEQLEHDYEPPPEGDGSSNRLVSEYELAISWLEGDLRRAIEIAQSMGDHCMQGRGFGFVTRMPLCANDYRAIACMLLGDLQCAREHFSREAEDTRVRMERDRNATVQKSVQLGRELSLLFTETLVSGKVDEAALTALVEQSEALEPQFRAPSRILLAWVLAWSGQDQQAIALLDDLLVAPWGPYAKVLARDPSWAVLYGSPGFEQMLTKRGAHLIRHPVMFYQPLASGLGTKSP